MVRGSDVDRMLGDPRKAIRSMLVPFLVALLAVQINVFADTFWVSGLGVSAVSAMTTSVPMYVLFTNIGVGVSVGATATIAFRIGRGEMEAAGRLAGNALVSGMVFAVAGSVFMAVSLDPLVSLMGADDVRGEVNEYILPFILMSPFVVLNGVFGGILRAEGAARRSTAIQMSGAVFNMVLDPILIYGFGLGLSGAALATVLSSSFGVAVAAYWYSMGRTQIRISRPMFRPDRAVSRELMTVAAPRTVDGLASTVIILLQRVFIIMAGGTAGVALFNVPFRYVNLAQCPCEATGMAMVPVAASAYGEGDIGRMGESMRYALRLVIAMSLALSIVLLALSEPLVAVFTTEETMAALKDEFVWNMRMYCIILPLFAVQTLGSSMLQAMKRSMKPMVLTIVLGVVKLFMFWIASYHDYRAITCALILNYVFSAVLMWMLAHREFRKLSEYSGSP